MGRKKVKHNAGGRKEKRILAGKHPGTQPGEGGEGRLEWARGGKGVIAKVEEGHERGGGPNVNSRELSEAISRGVRYETAGYIGERMRAGKTGEKKHCRWATRCRSSQSRGNEESRAGVRGDGQSFGW